MSGDKGISAFPDGDNLFRWIGTITGPSDTVWYNHILYYSITRLCVFITAAHTQCGRLLCFPRVIDWFIYLFFSANLNSAVCQPIWLKFGMQTGSGVSYERRSPNAPPKKNWGLKTEIFRTVPTVRSL